MAGETDVGDREECPEKCGQRTCELSHREGLVQEYD